MAVASFILGRDVRGICTWGLTGLYWIPPQAVFLVLSYVQKPQISASPPRALSRKANPQTKAFCATLKSDPLTPFIHNRRERGENMILFHCFHLFWDWYSPLLSICICLACQNHFHYHFKSLFSSEHRVSSSFQKSILTVFIF